MYRSPLPHAILPLPPPLPTNNPNTYRTPRSYIQIPKAQNANSLSCNQNKTNSAVQLKHLPTGIVVKSQATRSRSQNRTIARNLLAARLDELENGDASRSAAIADRKRKKRASAAKKSRRKYRGHEADKEAEGEEVEEDGDVEVERSEEIQAKVEGKGEATGEGEEGRHRQGEGKTGDSQS